jgi:hypothetical protein
VTTLIIGRNSLEAGIGILPHAKTEMKSAMVQQVAARVPGNAASAAYASTDKLLTSVSAT